MKKLIIESDDFGITPETSRVILQLLKKKMITSTNFIVNMPESKEDAKLAQRQGVTKMGIHINLDRHYPVSDPEKIPTLVDPSTQRFWSFDELLKREVAGRIGMSDVQREVYAQLELANKFKLEISHITTHHGLAFLDNKFFHLFSQITQETHLTLRNEIGPFFDPQNKDLFSVEDSMKNVFPNKNYALDAGQKQPFELIDFIRTQADDQSILVLGHAGKNDKLLEMRSSLNKRREEDLQTFADQRLHSFLTDPVNQIKLISY